MRKAISTVLSVVLVALATSAHARNVRDYQCGPSRISVAIVKDTGIPYGYQITIERKWTDVSKTQKVTSSGTFIFDGIEDPIAYLLNGKRYKCKEIPPFDATDDATLELKR
jgi:hypothetical protein